MCLGSSNSLNKFLPEKAKNNELDPVIDRESIVNRLIEILCRRTKNNPILIGKAGVGKTAIVEELERLIEKEQVPNKISNKKTEVPQTNEMNDKDYITTILSIEKEIVKNYAIAMTEASNDELCNDFHDMFDDVSEIQREVYNVMFKKGWYCLEVADENKIMQKLNTLEQELPQLENNN